MKATAPGTRNDGLAVAAAQASWRPIAPHARAATRYARRLGPMMIHLPVDGLNYKYTEQYLADSKNLISAKFSFLPHELSIVFAPGRSADQTMLERIGWN
jgi:hypothetical protein